MTLADLAISRANNALEAEQACLTARYALEADLRAERTSRTILELRVAELERIVSELRGESDNAPASGP